MDAALMIPTYLQSAAERLLALAPTLKEINGYLIKYNFLCQSSYICNDIRFLNFFNGNYRITTCGSVNNNTNPSLFPDPDTKNKLIADPVGSGSYLDMFVSKFINYSEYFLNLQ
jgi:hypothetical protein